VNGLSNILAALGAAAGWGRWPAARQRWRTPGLCAEASGQPLWASEALMLLPSRKFAIRSNWDASAANAALGTKTCTPRAASFPNYDI